MNAYINTLHKRFVIVGEIGYGGSVNDCAFIGNVVGTFNVGGIAGKVYDSGAILNCYHIGDVTGTENTGGIAGMVHTSNGNGTAILKNCYQVGKVTDERNKAGGIVGLAEYDESTGNVISIKNCYYLKTSATVGVNGKSVVDDCTALPENLLKKVAEDLGAFYIINPCASVVNGYPCFEWQIKGDVNADGKVTVADAVMLQKWLLCAGSLTDWQEADLYEDGRIDVFDLVLMKRILISKGD